MVEASSVRAENWNALSGSSRPSALSAGAACARRKSANSSRKARRRIASARRLARDPLEIRRQPAGERQGDDLGQLVRMVLADCRLEGRVALARCLDQHRILLGVLDAAFPPVDGA